MPRRSGSRSSTPRLTRILALQLQGEAQLLLFWLERKTRHRHVALGESGKQPGYLPSYRLDHQFASRIDGLPAHHA